MRFKTTCTSPLGDILLASDGQALTGLWFQGQKYCGAGLPEDAIECADLSIFAETRAWLDAFFAGGRPARTPRFAPSGTPFQQTVWTELQHIPYGATETYGGLARRIGERRGTPTSARAVGAAVGRNPISLIIPCHRVVGADGSLTGYAGGIWRKRELLALEQRGAAALER